MKKLGRLLEDPAESKKIIKILAVAALLITAFLLFGGNGENKTVSLKSPDKVKAEEAEEVDEDAGSKAGQSYIYVDVDGAVKNPGVYKVKYGSRVFQVIEKAGGLTKKADTSYINQADKVKDGQKITVGVKGGGLSGQTGSGSGQAGSSGAAGASGSGQAAETGLININSAGSDELQKIPGVGPSTAEKIINYRKTNGPFSKKEDIKNVSGIGDKTYEKMKDMITV
ncbi:MAG: helix-hairpin-helix domain-containing protein [Eubacteriales bacterium]|nr:helix-hairpin-helix domain-containing protein [Eubacteriales bacterium]